jgi:Uma2 family endonuclease
MSPPEKSVRYTPEEYLKLERQAETKHEYVDGLVYEMAGESLAHSQICINLAREISTQLRGKPCQALSPNMKVLTGEAGLFAYPDLAIVSGQPVFHDNNRDVLLNPKVIIEVLSPSTERYDRGKKFMRYSRLWRR